MSGSGIGANVFITGANRGIGLGLVKEIAKVSGIKNIFAGCRIQLVQRSCKILKKAQILCIKAAFNEVKKCLGSEPALNLLINNSGILENKAAMTTAAFLPLIRQAGASNQSAKILNISSGLGSTAGVQSSKQIPNSNIVYGMSKQRHIMAPVRALNHYTKALAGDVKENNVVAIAMCPGWVRTDMGTSAAMLSVDESVSAIVKLIASLEIGQSGAYLDRLGKTIAF
uniref:C-factor n=1 Tax=Ditylenchus dipsaci TaxID=166011 RepID=A0A915D2B8_9BILA